jgi:hypothetical protein
VTASAFIERALGDDALRAGAPCTLRTPGRLRWCVLKREGFQMQRTQRLRPFVDEEPSRGTMPIVVGSAFAVLAVGYALLVLQPDIVRQLATSLGTMFPGGPNWAVPAMATGIAIGGAAVAVFVLSHFARGVQQSPYIWFAPVLVGFSTVVMGRLPTTLPLNDVPGELFALLTAFMWLGGGALMQLPGWAPRTAGAILFTLPSVGLVVAHAQHAGGLGAALASLDAGSQFFMFVFWLTWLGVGMLSIVTRDSAFAGKDRRLLARVVDQARRSEEQLAEAQRRVSLAEEEVQTLRASQSPFAPFADDGALEAMKPSGFGLPIKIGAAMLAVAVLGAAGYYGFYQPREAETGQQLAAAERAVTAQQSAVAAMKDELESERARMQEEMKAARDKASEAETALAAAQTRLAELEGAEQPEAAVEPEPASKAPAKASAKAKAKPRAKAPKAQPAAATASARPKQTAAERRAEAAKQKAERAEKQRLAREARKDNRALGGRVSDDPIAGLDGF